MSRKRIPSSKKSCAHSITIPNYFAERNSIAGLRALVRAFTFASDVGAGAWEFALEIEQLYSTGLSISDIRWLVARGLVEHGQEITKAGEAQRSFTKGAGLFFAPGSCLVLTAEGAAHLAEFVWSKDSEKTGSPDSNGGRSAPSSTGEITPSTAVYISPTIEENPTPRWIPELRELWLGDQLVKKFRVPACNQEWIIEVFEEDGWPVSIDDPLPPKHGMDPKIRLHDAINRLNGRQVNKLLRFHGNGSGKSIYWKAIQPTASVPTSAEAI